MNSPVSLVSLSESVRNKKPSCR